jgi:hypothetical protein
VLAAAAAMGRSWIGIERDPKEARFAARRLLLRRRQRLARAILPGLTPGAKPN